MNPGALTPVEGRAEVIASLFKTVHPHLPLDPTLRFHCDIGLDPSRRVRLADIAKVAAAYVLPGPVPAAVSEIARWDVADDGAVVTHTAVDAAGRTLGVVVRGKDARYRCRVGDVVIGHEAGRNGLQSAKQVLAKALRRSA